MQKLRGDYNERFTAMLRQRNERQDGNDKIPGNSMRKMRRCGVRQESCKNKARTA